MREARLAAANAVRFLAREQLPWGELPTQVGSHPALAGEVRLDSTTTVSALAVQALDAVPEGEETVASCRRFLAEIRAGDGTWSYWTDRSPTRAPIDPDADDTALAAAAIGLPPDDPVAARLQDNRDPGGRYLTWLRRPSARNDVDVVVNAHVIGWLADPSDPAWPFVAAEVSGGEAWSTGYYLHRTYPLLAVARAAVAVGRSDEVRAGLRRRALALRSADGAFGGPGATAAAVSALHLVGALDPELARPAIETLLAEPGLEWPVELLWRGPEPPSPPSIFWGSRSLGAAWRAEALTRVLTASW